MIIEKYDDIMNDINFSKNIDVVFHQCNCFLTMGSGIAKTLSSKYPQIRSADNATIWGNKDKLGDFTYSNCINDIGKKFSIFNIYGQYSYKYGKLTRGNVSFYFEEEYGSNGKLKPMTSLLHLERGINKMINYINNKDVTFATVKIGCGRGGANWESEVFPMLHKLFRDNKLIIYYGEG